MINPSASQDARSIKTETFSHVVSFEQAYERYQRLCRYVGWTDADVKRVRAVGKLVGDRYDELVDDFYEQILKEPEAVQVLSGGDAQIARLKRTLYLWLDELFAGPFDEAYIAKRWRVGWRHVEIGLRQAYPGVAIARLRSKIAQFVAQDWSGSPSELAELLRSVGLRLDLDLAMIDEAYSTEYSYRRAQSERQRGEAVFRKVVESSGCMIVILREDYSIAYFSPFAEEISGHGAADVSGKNYLMTLLPDEAKPGVEEELRRLFSRGEASNGYENPIVCRDGTHRWLVWNAQRLDEFEGRPAVLAIGHDITRRKLAEERAFQSERLAAIGQMITGLAHESRNAFQRSQACLEVLATDLEQQPEQLELVGRIQRALDHLHHLYEEVRDYAAPIKLDRQVCNLGHIWRDSWTHLDVIRSGKEIQFVEDTGGIDLTCNCDWFAIGQVFRNIFENAIAACPLNGKITVRCRRAKFHGSSAIRISICDNGAGILPDVASRVFEPFFTTKTKGTGLGMAISKRLVEAHGGQVAVGEGGPGAEFVVVMPKGLG